MLGKKHNVCGGCSRNTPFPCCNEFCFSRTHETKRDEWATLVTVVQLVHFIADSLSFLLSKISHCFLLLSQLVPVVVGTGQLEITQACGNTDSNLT